MERILRVSKKFILGFCACRCGKEIAIRNALDRLGRFTHGHNRRLVDHGRVCFGCGRDNVDHWYNLGEWFCKSCNNKYFIDPTLIYFKTRSIRVKEFPRKGQCQKCGKKVGDSYVNCEGETAIIKLTHIHHREYHEGDPLKDTVELCVSCHIKESWELGCYDSLKSQRNL